MLHHQSEAECHPQIWMAIKVADSQIKTFVDILLGASVHRGGDPLAASIAGYPHMDGVRAMAFSDA
jgi:hypothetical protein